MRKAEEHEKENQARERRRQEKHPPLVPIAPLRPDELERTKKELFALDATCFHKALPPSPAAPLLTLHPHQAGPLAIGDIEEVVTSQGSVDCVKCPWHGRLVSLSSGEYLTRLGVCGDKSDHKVENHGVHQRTHHTVYKDGKVVIHIGVASEGGERALVSKVRIPQIVVLLV